MTTAKRSSDVAGIFWQAALVSCIVVWSSFISDVIALWFTEDKQLRVMFRVRVRSCFHVCVHACLRLCLCVCVCVCVCV